MAFIIYTLVVFALGWAIGQLTAQPKCETPEVRW